MNSLDNFKTPIQYFPIKIGNAEIKKWQDFFVLYVNEQRYMTWDPVGRTEIYETGIEILNGYGDVTTTGLGFGLKEICLLQNPRVKNVTVFEKSNDVIEIFKTFADKAGIDISRLKIVNADADRLENHTCNCLFLDHYAGSENFLESVRKIASKNTYNLLWYWPSLRDYSSWLTKTSQEPNHNTWHIWTESLNIENFPKTLSDVNLNFIKEYHFGVKKLNEIYRKKYIKRDLEVL